MADLLSHVLIGHIVKRLSPWSSGALAFAVGSALPDVAGRMPRVALFLLERKGDLGAPPMAYDIWSASHLPIPYVVLCVLIALVTPSLHRKMVFRNVILGGLGHMAVDFTQTHIDPTIYRYLWPFTFEGMELGWVGTEASLAWLPALIPLAGLVEWRHRRRARIASETPADR